MRKNLFWKITFILLIVNQVHAATDQVVGTLSEGACWYEYKDSLRIASFNDKTAYSGNMASIESDLEVSIAKTLNSGERIKINEMDLTLHCGGYGASLVAQVTTESNSFCVWAKFDQGHISIRSLGVNSDEGPHKAELCDGHKLGEFILGSNSEDLITELQSTKWSSMIKAVTIVSKKVYKVELVKEYEFREQEVIDQLQQNFNGKNFIRYIEFNNYNHPIGEYIHLK